MRLADFLKTVVAQLKKDKVRFALAGGFAASLYRHDERLTKDLDFLILSEGNNQEKASEIILSFGLEPHIIRKADLEGGPLFAIKSRRTPPYMVVGRKEGDSSVIGLDFILSNMPWFGSALTRAEHNHIHFGFGTIPCLTREDTIISKLFALKNDSSRFHDLDDLKSIFLTEHPLDLAYLSGQMQKLAIPMPKTLYKMAPKALVLVLKKKPPANS